MQLNFRQGIASADESFLLIHGQNVSIIAVETPCVINLAHGVTDYLHIENATVHNAWLGPFTTQTWLYWDIDIITGKRTFGKTTISPTYGSTYPQSPQINQHFFDIKEMRMKVWIGNRWETKIRVFAGNIIGNSLIQNNIGSQINVLQQRNVGCILFDQSDKPLKQLDSENRSYFFTTESILSTTYNPVQIKHDDVVKLYKFEKTIPAFSAVTITKTGNIDIASSQLSIPAIGITVTNNYRDGYGRIITSGYVSNPNWNFKVSPMSPVWVGNNGEITTTPSTKFSLQKLGNVINDTTILLRIEDMMLINGTFNYVDPTPTPTPTPSMTVTPTQA